MLNGRRQPSLGRTSRVNREVYARFCERLAVRFRGPTRQLAVRHFGGTMETSASFEARLAPLSYPTTAKQHMCPAIAGRKDSLCPSLRPVRYQLILVAKPAAQVACNHPQFSEKLSPFRRRR